MAPRSLVLVLVAMQAVSAFRMKRERSAQKTIAGVPVFNYDLVEASSSSLLEGAPATRDWILMFKDDTTASEFEAFCEGSKVSCTTEGHTGFVPFVEVHGTEADVKELLEAHPDEIAFVEPDADTFAIPELPADADGESSVQSLWGLDKIGKTSGLRGGKGVHVYVMDTGVRTTHSDFAGRAIPTLEYLSTSPKVCYGDTSCAADRHGHGTHCAGTVGGNQYGVATEATLHGVKVLSDGGSGSVSWIVGAIDWIASQGERPAVASLSLGGAGRSAAYQTAMDVATNKGVTIVVAAGNNNADACNFSPAYVTSAFTVGSTASGDGRSSFSNYGSCVQIYAPGSSIQSAGHRSDTASATMSGTSMACPHVAGAAALVLAANKNMQPSQVKETLLAKATSNALSGLTSTCPNKLLSVRGLTGDGPSPTPAPTSAPTPAPTPDTGCVDKNANCPSWATAGYCETNSQYYQYMMENCCASCQCRDMHTSCPSWAQLGYCSSSSQYYAYMMQNCRVSCSVC